MILGPYFDCSPCYWVLLWRKPTFSEQQLSDNNILKTTEDMNLKFWMFIISVYTDMKLLVTIG